MLPALEMYPFTYIALGMSRHGKSHFMCHFTHDSGLFKTSDSGTGSSTTMRSDSKWRRPFNTHSRSRFPWIRVVDTTGLGDTAGAGRQQLQWDANKIYLANKVVKANAVVFIWQNGTQVLNSHVKRELLQYRQMFGLNFWKTMTVVFTKFDSATDQGARGFYERLLKSAFEDVEYMAVTAEVDDKERQKAFIMNPGDKVQVYKSGSQDRHHDLLYWQGGDSTMDMRHVKGVKATVIEIKTMKLPKLDDTTKVCRKVRVQENGTPWYYKIDKFGKALRNSDGTLKAHQEKGRSGRRIRCNCMHTGPLQDDLGTCTGDAFANNTVQDVEMALIRLDLNDDQIVKKQRLVPGFDSTTKQNSDIRVDLHTILQTGDNISPRDLGHPGTEEFYENGEQIWVEAAILRHVNDTSRDIAVEEAAIEGKAAIAQLAEDTVNRIFGVDLHPLRRYFFGGSAFVRGLDDTLSALEDLLDSNNPLAVCESKSDGSFVPAEQATYYHIHSRKDLKKPNAKSNDCTHVAEGKSFDWDADTFYNYLIVRVKKDGEDETSKLVYVQCTTRRKEFLGGSGNTAGVVMRTRWYLVNRRSNSQIATTIAQMKPPAGWSTTRVSDELSDNDFKIDEEGWSEIMARDGGLPRWSKCLFGDSQGNKDMHEAYDKFYNATKARIKEQLASTRAALKINPGDEDNITAKKRLKAELKQLPDTKTIFPFPEGGKSKLLSLFTFHPGSSVPTKESRSRAWLHLLEYMNAWTEVTNTKDVPSKEIHQRKMVFEKLQRNSSNVNENDLLFSSMMPIQLEFWEWLLNRNPSNNGAAVTHTSAPFFKDRIDSLLALHKNSVHRFQDQFDLQLKHYAGQTFSVEVQIADETGKPYENSKTRKDHYAMIEGADINSKMYHLFGEILQNTIEKNDLAGQVSRKNIKAYENNFWFNEQLMPNGDVQTSDGWKKFQNSKQFQNLLGAYIRQQGTKLDAKNIRFRGSHNLSCKGEDVPMFGSKHDKIRLQLRLPQAAGVVKFNITCDGEDYERFFVPVTSKSTRDDALAALYKLPEFISLMKEDLFLRDNATSWKPKMIALTGKHKDQAIVNFKSGRNVHKFNGALRAAFRTGSDQYDVNMELKASPNSVLDKVLKIVISKCLPKDADETMTARKELRRRFQRFHIIQREQLAYLSDSDLDVMFQANTGDEDVDESLETARGYFGQLRDTMWASIDDDLSPEQNELLKDLASVDKSFLEAETEKAKSVRAQPDFFHGQKGAIGHQAEMDLKDANKKQAFAFPPELRKTTNLRVEGGSSESRTYIFHDEVYASEMVKSSTFKKHGMFYFPSENQRNQPTNLLGRARLALAKLGQLEDRTRFGLKNHHQEAAKDYQATDYHVTNIQTTTLSISFEGDLIPSPSLQADFANAISLSGSKLTTKMETIAATYGCYAANTVKYGDSKLHFKNSSGMSVTGTYKGPTREFGQKRLPVPDHNLVPIWDLISNYIKKNVSYETHLKQILGKENIDAQLQTMYKEYQKAWIKHHSNMKALVSAQANVDANDYRGKLIIEHFEDPKDWLTLLKKHVAYEEPEGAWDVELSRNDPSHPYLVQGQPSMEVVKWGPSEMRPEFIGFRSRMTQWRMTKRLTVYGEAVTIDSVTNLQSSRSLLKPQLSQGNSNIATFLEAIIRNTDIILAEMQKARDLQYCNFFAVFPGAQIEKESESQASVYMSYHWKEHSDWYKIQGRAARAGNKVIRSDDQLMCHCFHDHEPSKMGQPGRRWGWAAPSTNDPYKCTMGGWQHPDDQPFLPLQYISKTDSHFFDKETENETTDYEDLVVGDTHPDKFNFESFEELKDYVMTHSHIYMDEGDNKTRDFEKNKIVFKTGKFWLDKQGEEHQVKRFYSNQNWVEVLTKRNGPDDPGSVIFTEENLEYFYHNPWHYCVIAINKCEADKQRDWVNSTRDHIEHEDVIYNGVEAWNSTWKYYGTAVSRYDPFTGRQLPLNAETFNLKYSGSNEDIAFDHKDLTPYEQYEELMKKVRDSEAENSKAQLKVRSGSRRLARAKQHHRELRKIDKSYREEDEWKATQQALQEIKALWAKVESSHKQTKH